MGFAVNAVLKEGEDNATGGTRTRSSVVCSNCGRSGHEKKDCWQIIGFPEWYTERNQSGGRERDRTNSSRANAVHAHGTSSHGASGNHTSLIPQLTPDQWASLTALLERQKTTPIPVGLNGTVQTGEVIIDTGASHHMTGDVTLLSDVHSVIPCPVSFADGSNVMAIKSGNLRLSSSLTLKNVLYVPNLNCTLLLVAKLLRQTGCLAVFTDIFYRTVLRGL